MAGSSFAAITSKQTPHLSSFGLRAHYDASLLPTYHSPLSEGRTMQGSTLLCQTYRLFLCARCQGQVSICASCDRGQLYCGQGCAQQSRRERSRSASQRYQQSDQGRQRHAERQARYRQKRRLGRSDHGDVMQSLPAPLQAASSGALPADTTPASHCISASIPTPPLVICALCGARCQPYARYASLRERQRRSGRRQPPWPPRHPSATTAGLAPATPRQPAGHPSLPTAGGDDAERTP